MANQVTLLNREYVQQRKHLAEFSAKQIVPLSIEGGGITPEEVLEIFSGWMRINVRLAYHWEHSFGIKYINITGKIATVNVVPA